MTDKKKRYKLVVKTRYDTYVKTRSKNKQHLEDIAIKLSLKSPHTKFYVVEDSVTIQCIINVTPKYILQKGFTFDSLQFNIYYVNVEATWTHSGPGGGTQQLHQMYI